MKFSSLTILTFLLGASLFFFGSPAYSQNCSVRTLSGNYAVQASGISTEDPDFPNQQISYNSIGRATFDGTGNWTGTFFTNDTGRGYTKIGPVTGTYILKSDCTGTITIGNGVAHFALVVAEGGNEYYSLSKQKGNTRLAIGKRQ